MSKPKVYLYAEALTHIRQLTLYASLETEKNEHTKILISSDKKTITAVHDGEASSIYLPTQISGTAHVSFPIDKKTEISIRLQIDDVSQLKPNLDEPGGIEVPWAAGDLTENTSIWCKSCGAGILHAGQVTVWKDLPSEHWAELMDFWFCHKPHDHATQEHAAESKGFSSTSKFTASPGVGLVDAVSFLLHEQDCAELQVSLHTPREPTSPIVPPAQRKRLFKLVTEFQLIKFLIHSPHINFVPRPRWLVPTSLPVMDGRLSWR